MELEFFFSNQSNRFLGTMKVSKGGCASQVVASVPGDHRLVDVVQEMSSVH